MMANRDAKGIRPVLWIGAAALLAIGGRALAQPPAGGATMEQRVRQLEDRAEIDQLISRLGQILDARDLPALATVATPQFAAVMNRNLGQIKSVWQDTQHIMSDRWIEIDGDKATVKANLLGSNMGRQIAGRPAGSFDAAGREQFEVRGRYVYSLVRTPQGWRIADTDLKYLWTTGAMPAIKP